METITKLNWVDILIIILCLRISYVGLQDGLSHEIFPLIASFLSLIISLHYYEKLAFFAQGMVRMPIELLRFMAFLILLIGLGIVLKIIRAIVDKIINVTWHPLLEKFGGLAFGFVRAAVVTSTVLILLALMPLSYLQWSIRDKSLMGMYFLRIGPRVYERVSVFLPAVKFGGAHADREGLTRKIVADKSIETKPRQKEEKTSDWEKVLKP